MALAMSRPWRDPKTGIWYLRKRVPKDLLALVGRPILKASLGKKDAQVARQRHIAELAALEARWVNLRAGCKQLTEREAHEIARVAHDDWLAFHRDEPSLHYWAADLYPELWTASPQPEVEPQPGVPGTCSIENLIYPFMGRLCAEKADNLLADRGLIVDDWSRNTLVKAVGAAFQRATLKLIKQSESYYETGEDVKASPPDRTEPVEPPGRPPAGPPIRSANEGASAKISLTQILEDWWREAKAAGRKPSTYESYRNTIDNLTRFLKHDEAARITPADVVAFKDHRLTTPSPRTGKIPSAKTVKDSDLSALKTIFGWAVANHRLAINPALGLTIKLGKAPRLRPKYFTEAEAHTILYAAYHYENNDEQPGTAAAKRWVPWLLAFTGARVGEMAQLRRQDVRLHGKDWVVRITPEAGTQKTNEARDVPLHPQLVEIGFPVFVEACGDGHLFLTPGQGGDVLGPLQGLKNRLAEFGRSIVPDPGVAPNHGWRHRFKTVGLEAGIDSRVFNEIQGQAAQSVADTYGAATLKTMATAIAKLTPFEINKFIQNTEPDTVLR